MRLLENLFKDVAVSIQRGERDGLEWLTTRVKRLADTLTINCNEGVLVTEYVLAVSRDKGKVSL